MLAELLIRHRADAELAYNRQNLSRLDTIHADWVGSNLTRYGFQPFSRTFIATSAGSSSSAAKMSDAKTDPPNSTKTGHRRRALDRTRMTHYLLNTLLLKVCVAFGKSLFLRVRAPSTRFREMTLEGDGIYARQAISCGQPGRQQTISADRAIHTAAFLNHPRPRIHTALSSSRHADQMMLRS